MMAMPMKTLKLDYPIIQFLLMSIGLMIDCLWLMIMSHTQNSPPSLIFMKFFQTSGPSCRFHEGIPFIFAALGICSWYNYIHENIAWFWLAESSAVQV